uniref:Uncharacterized protein n=1 Tax=Arundo donax TaxID=35708 RepID=A0A0A8Z9E4_ARUDO
MVATARGIGVALHGELFGDTMKLNLACCCGSATAAATICTEERMAG